MTDSDLRVGLLGFGLAGSAFHAPLIAATPGLRLAVVATSDPHRAAEARRRFADVDVVEDADALLARAENLDLVVIATPNRTHVPLALDALEAGLPVVVDKPLAPTTEGGRRLVAAARDRGLLFTVFQSRRWDGDFLTARRLVEGGRLGRVLLFESRFERWRPQPKPGWRQRGGAEEAGGVLFDLGSHLVDQALLLFGPVESVYAELDPGYPGAEVDNDAFVALRHRSGVRSHLRMSSLAAHPGPRFRILGDRAGWRKEGLDPQEDALRAGRRPDEDDAWGEEAESRWGLLVEDGEAVPVPSEPGDYPAFYRELERTFRTRTPPPVDPDDAIRGLEILEAAQRSAAEGRVVPL